MNDLGITLAWLAVQVALVLAPALALCALASRRGPAAGAWVASLSLGLVVALNASAFLPGVGRGRPVGGGRLPASARSGGTATADRAPSDDHRDASRPSAVWDRAFSGVRVAWASFERGAGEPAARCRPWGTLLAVAALAGTAVGLLRLALGLCAVAACHRRGNAVDDPDMVALLTALREAIGCPGPVELREVPGVLGPATAGWRRPVILLPDDWRSWTLEDRRAVLAHELAHVVRGDYAAGLLARLAVALNYFHPLVHCAAGRLRLEQELAADALGARYAGGRIGYLAALSRMALKQDERSRCWPARAFLPARGTLIRRIAMLRNENQTVAFDRPWSRARRLSTALLLLGLTAAVAALRGPARGAEDGAPAAQAPDAHDGAAPPDFYLRDKRNGVVVLRPAAAFRHAGMARFAHVLDSLVDSQIMAICSGPVGGADTPRPGSPKLSLKDLEWVAFDLGFDKGPKNRNPQEKDLHRMLLSFPVIRTAAPFDWPAYLRRWRFELAEVREGGRRYYRVSGPACKSLGPGPSGVYLPDDRTLVLDSEPEIRKLVLGKAPAPRPYLRGDDWARACRGLLAVAINNEKGSFARDYDLGRPDDKVVLSMFKGVDRWIFGVDDAGSITLNASAACQDAGASRALAQGIEPLLKLARDELENPDPAAPVTEAEARACRMLKALLSHLRIERSDRSVDLRAEGFGTIADFASIVEAQGRDDQTAARDGRGGTKDLKR
jgi:hypothetical protein